MGARSKLNRAYFTGSLTVAAVIGWVTQSWLGFLIALAIFVALNLHAGEIRTSRRSRR